MQHAKTKQRLKMPFFLSPSDQGLFSVPDEYSEKHTALQEVTRLPSRNLNRLFQAITEILQCTPNKVKTQYLQFRSHAEYFLLSWKIIEVIRVSTINICTQSLLVWKWIDDKFGIKWKYLLCYLQILRFYFVGQEFQ